MVYFIIILFTPLLIAYKLRFGYKLVATPSFTAARNKLGSLDFSAIWALHINQ